MSSEYRREGDEEVKKINKAYEALLERLKSEGSLV